MCHLGIRPCCVAVALGAACSAGEAVDTAGTCDPDAQVGCQVEVVGVEGVSGGTQRRSTNTYDEQGNRLSSDYDSDCTIDDLVAYAYELDTYDNVVRMELDLGADGTVDYVSLYTYDYAYDEAGEPLPVDCYQLDSTAEYGSSYQLCNTWNAEGLLVGVDVYSGGSDAISQRNEYTYDAAGRLLSAQWNIVQQGTSPVVYEYTYTETYTYAEDCAGPGPWP